VGEGGVSAGERRPKPGCAITLGSQTGDESLPFPRMRLLGCDFVAMPSHLASVANRSSNSCYSTNLFAHPFHPRLGKKECEESYSEKTHVHGEYGDRSTVLVHKRGMCC
jgi:hypothetical protein